MKILLLLEFLFDYIKKVMVITINFYILIDRKYLKYIVANKYINNLYIINK